MIRRKKKKSIFDFMNQLAIDSIRLDILLNSQKLKKMSNQKIDPFSIELPHEFRYKKGLEQLNRIEITRGFLKAIPEPYSTMAIMQMSNDKIDICPRDTKEALKVFARWEYTIEGKEFWEAVTLFYSMGMPKHYPLPPIPGQEKKEQ